MATRGTTMINNGLQGVQEFAYKVNTSGGSVTANRNIFNNVTNPNPTTAFTLSTTPVVNSVVVYYAPSGGLSGVIAPIPSNYLISGNVITFVNPITLDVGDSLIIDYLT